MAVLHLATEMANDIGSGVENTSARRTRTKKNAKGAIKREGSRIWEAERSKGANGKRERPKGKKGRARVCKGEIIKKVRKQKGRGVPAAKMAVPLAKGGRSF